MKFPLRFLPAAAVLGMALLASCNSTTFTVPKIGTRFDEHKSLLEYDTSLNMYVIPLEKYETLEYEHFIIAIPKEGKAKYYASASSNSSNFAEFNVRNLPPQTDFSGHAIYAQEQEGWKSLADMEAFFREKFSPGRGVISRSVHITKRNGHNCIEYDVVANTAEAGKVSAVHGFCMFDPNNPGYIFDVFAGRTAYKKDIDDDFLIEASGYFLESVKFRK